MSKRTLLQPLIGLLSLAVLWSSTACAIGPKYMRPELRSPPAYKEAPPSGWTDAQPNYVVARGQWWRLFNNPASTGSRVR